MGALDGVELIDSTVKNLPGHNDPRLAVSLDVIETEITKMREALIGLSEFDANRGHRWSQGDFGAAVSQSGDASATRGHAEGNRYA